ncbi:LysM domain-containing protein [Aliiruegeria haliotis]|uniref:LysM domain-containing protein n=1 Tax=Aliiruegeria haliotis TaxID=1280846 RepID=A0A2T0RVP6_9RHOB|nr:LysM peptidoglycan-binding domain-containing protein [Aliiruegeria haliotis]PRY25227.1 LysM domain-containing protein [Aliiruegeria haliotis]
MSEKGTLGGSGGIAALAAVAVIGGLVFWFTRPDGDSPAPTPQIPVADASAELSGTDARPDPVAETEEVPPSSPAPAPADGEVADAATVPDAPDTSAAAETSDTSDQQNSGEDAALGPPPPGFDIVRVAADGAALVAGTAPIGFDVSLVLDGAEVSRAAADGSGAFVALFDMPVSEAAQVLELVAYGPGGEEVRSEDSVILAPHQNAPVVAETATKTDPAPDTQPDTPDTELADGSAEAASSGDAPVREEAAVQEIADSDAPPVAMVGEIATDRKESLDTALANETPDRDADRPESDVGIVAEVPTNTGSPERVARASGDMPAAPTVLLARKGEVELLQPASVVRERLSDRVVIDVISYSDDGSVTLSGRAAGAAPTADRVRVYLNNKPVQTAKVAADGSWRMRLPPVKPGIYTLRVDQVDAAGVVVARFETPFKREDPSDLARLVPEVDGPSGVAASVITVQPGYTLWGIASDRYGDGLDYVQIFEANRTQIRDPDLIYPGQVFELPDGDGDTATE